MTRYSTQTRNPIHQTSHTQMLGSRVRTTSAAERSAHLLDTVVRVTGRKSIRHVENRAPAFFPQFLSASLYFSRWSLVVTRVHCGQTVHPRPIVTMEH